MAARHEPGTYVRGNETWSQPPDPDRIGPYQHCNRELYWFVRKDGSLGAAHELTTGWYTELLQCDRCGKWGSPRRVHYRDDAYCHDLGLTKCTLCMGCWNRQRAIVRRYQEILKLKTLTRKLRGTRQG